MRASRRAFLTGGGALASAWGRFCLRLARSVRGRLEDLSEPREAGYARLRAARAEDVRHALAIAAEAGVGVSCMPGPCPGQPLLYLDVSALEAIRRDGAVLAVEPGARVAQVRAMAAHACPGAPEAATVLSWLAEPAWHGWQPLASAGSGLTAADVVFADGAAQSLGPFGAASAAPALGATASRCVSQLFTLAREPALDAWLQAPVWPMRFRLDTLRLPEPNLAHLLLGGAGALAWPERLYLAIAPPAAGAEAAARACESAGAAGQGACGDGAGEPGAQADARVRALERRVRDIFDPAGVFA